MERLPTQGPVSLELLQKISYAPGPDHYHRGSRWGYTVLPPTDLEPGTILIHAIGNQLPGYQTGYESWMQDFHNIMPTQTGQILSQLGFGVDFDRDPKEGKHRQAYLQYASPEQIVHRLKPYESNFDALDLPKYRIFHGNQYSMYDGVRALKEGVVLLSDSRAVTTYLAGSGNSLDLLEQETYMGHDIILHFPAWFGLPPIIFREIKATAQELCEGFDFNAPEHPSQSVRRQQIRDFIAAVDSTMIVNRMSWLVESENKGSVHNLGNNLKQKILRNSFHLSAEEIETVIYEYILEPRSLKQALDIAQAYV